MRTVVVSINSYTIGEGNKPLSQATASDKVAGLEQAGLGIAHSMNIADAEGVRKQGKLCRVFETEGHNCTIVPAGCQGIEQVEQKYGVTAED